MTDEQAKNSEPVAWRFPLDTYHMAHTSDPQEAAKYRDAEPLFTADEPGLWRFWNEKAREQADLITSLRKQLEEARAEIARCHARLEIDHYFTVGDDFWMSRKEVPMDERASFPDAVTCRDATIAFLQKDLTEARKKALEEATRTALAIIPEGGGKLVDERRDHAHRIAAAIRNLAGDQP